MGTNLKPNFLILAGDGINCENETKFAVDQAGGNGTIVHIADLLDKSVELCNFQALIFPGGFSFGDDLGSGRVLALKIKTQLKDELLEFSNGKKPILGICNGFQILMKMGLLPTPDFNPKGTLVHNEPKGFINRWATLKVNKNSPCIWTKNFPEQIRLPIRNGEGRLILDPKIVKMVEDNNLGVLSYVDYQNGSYNNLTGLCDKTGYIFGLMPHPEGALLKLTNWKNSMDMPYEENFGMAFFKNAIKTIQEN